MSIAADCVFCIFDRKTARNANKFPHVFGNAPDAVATEKRVFFD